MLEFLNKLLESFAKRISTRRIIIQRQDQLKDIAKEQETFFPSFEESNNPDAVVDNSTIAEKLAKFSAGNDIIEDIEKEVKVENKVKVSEIVIYFKNNEVFSWTHERPVDSNIFPWAAFYKWYLTKNTPLFCFHDIKEENIFRREDIVRVKIIKTYIKQQDANA